MKIKGNSSDKKNRLNESGSFYKNLEDKYQSLFKSRQLCVKQSKGKQNSRVMRASSSKSKKPANNKTQKKGEITYLHLISTQDQIEMSHINDNYQFDSISADANHFADKIHSLIEIQKPKFVCIQIINSCSQDDSHDQITERVTAITPYIEPIIKRFLKATVCIYSMAENSTKQQYYDMLSIRRQIKTDTKLLVQTNICNNSKSGVILKKLVDVAHEREKKMKEDIRIGLIAIKIKGVVMADKQNSNGKQIQIQITNGGLGEVGNKDLMGADKMRIFFNLLSFTFQSFTSPLNTQFLSKFKKSQKEISEDELKQKIKSLQMQLEEKKKQLQYEKQKIAQQEAIQAELEDIALPSERPMINIQKYGKKYNLGYRKSLFRSQKHD